MNTKSIRRLDGQGRVILPAHIRKALNLTADSAVTIEMDADGSIRIRPAGRRCLFCGEDLIGHSHVTMTSDKYVCKRCADRIAHWVQLLKEAEE